MSPKFFLIKFLKIISSVIHAALDVFIYQGILSLILSIFSENITFEVRVFLSGVIVLCMAFNSLFKFGILFSPIEAERNKIINSGLTSGFLSVLFCFTSENYVPLLPVIMSLIVFFAVDFFIRYSFYNMINSGRTE